MIQRAWRTHALRTVVAAKLFGLHVAAPGEEVAEDGEAQLAREPRLMGGFVKAITGYGGNTSCFTGRPPFYGLQGLDLATMRLLEEVPALKKYGGIGFDYEGQPAPRAVPQLPKQVSWAAQ